MPAPRFPLYVISKSRYQWGRALTVRELTRMGVPFRVVIEEHQHNDYAALMRRLGLDESRLIHLDPRYIDEYDPMCKLDPDESKGSGPARNFVWNHSVDEGWSHHWLLDDNIAYFMRLHRNRRLRCGDGTPFHAMEQFTLRWRGVAISGPHYKMFAPAGARIAPFITGSRVMSCLLIRNDIPFRWRCRYNEDIDLSLRALKAGWQTILFFAFLQDKKATQLIPGGNTEAFYAAEGTYAKSQMLVDLHPDVARITRRFGRWHHHVDYSRWRNRPLVPAVDPPDPVGYRLVVQPTRPLDVDAG